MSIKANDYCGAKSCGCRADEYDLDYWKNNNTSISKSEIEEAKIRMTEIDSILENNLYEDGIEEGDLLNERDMLEEILIGVDE